MRKSRKKVGKSVLSVALVIALLFSMLIIPEETKAAGWPDVAKELTLGSTITGSIKSGDFTGVTEDKSYSFSYYWNVYRFTMPKTGLLNIHLESQNKMFMNYESGYAGSDYSGFAIFSAENPDTLIWRSRSAENKINSNYSAAREMYYGATDISLDQGVYYFIVRYYRTYDNPYYLTLSYKEPVYSVTSLNLNKSKMNLNIGDTQTIQVAVVPDNATVKGVTWKSTAPSVATVDNGVVKAVSAGTASIIVSSLDGAVSAACEVTVNPLLEDYEYKVLEDGTAEITRYTGTAKEVAIPAKLEGRSVSAIGSRAFQNSDALETLKIPDGVEKIGTYAFQNCSRLTGLDLPASVAEIGDYAFQNCNSLTSLTIPQSVNVIGNGVFQNCYQLASVSLPNGIEEIGSFAFQNCSSLKSMNLPDTVSIIRNAAFSACSSLEQVSLPNGLKSIENSAFYGCGSLAEIDIPEAVERIGESAFEQCAKDFKMNVVKGSYAADYAESNGLSYAYMEAPDATEKPDVTEKPDATKEPDATEEPGAIERPSETEKPTSTNEPATTQKPADSTNPSITGQGGGSVVNPPQQPDRTDVSEKPSLLKKLKLSSFKYNRKAKKITGKLSVSKATVRIRIGKGSYKKTKMKGKIFSLKLSAPLKKKTKVMVQVTKKGYKKLTKTYRI